MARSSAQAKSLESKALANPNKSAGMRTLFEAGYTVAAVRQLFGAPYGYVYGVADRAGFAQTAANRRAPRKAAAATTSRKSAKASAKTTRAARTQAREQKATPAARSPKARATTPPTAKVTKVASATTTSAVARTAAKLAAKAKPGRPSPARRAANRRQPVAATA